VARQASRVARWFFIVLTSLAMLAYGYWLFYDALPSWQVVIYVTTMVLMVVQIALLFREDARAWFRGDLRGDTVGKVFE
jgi:hypothetical protein